MAARPYDPASGRFLQTDPIPGGSANNYDYANQNPINNYDLNGTVNEEDPGSGGMESMGEGGGWGAGLGEGDGYSTNVANGPRLAAQLTEQEAKSVFTRTGGLQRSVIRGSRVIVDGRELGNKLLVRMLTSDGSNIGDWAKYSTPTFRSPTGPFDVHFYYNFRTDEVFTDLDYKSMLHEGFR
jgi:hypothetical protein